MRLRLRAAGFLALAVVAITCTESTTGPRTAASGAQVPGRVTMTPEFTPAAARAYQALAATGTVITEVHVVLTAADGSTRDTVIAFPVGQDTLTIEIPVFPSQNDQPFTALLELRAADHTVLFTGTQVVVARAANLPPLSPPVVKISYSGPGKRTRTVAISPPDTTVTGTPALAYVATAIDSSNAVVTNLLVQWATSDATVAALTATGNATATVQATGKRGFATLSASTPTGIVGSAKLTVVPPATKLVVISGGTQTGVAGSTLPQPLVIEAQAADNLPVPGTKITFSAVTVGGSVTTAAVTADAAGRASTTLTLGKTGGTYQYAATAPTLPTVTVTQTATPAPAAALALVSGDGQTDSTGRTLTLPLTVKVTDAFGGPTAGATVAWTLVSGSGALGAATTTSAVDGTTSTTYTLGTVVGNDVVTATVAGVSGSAGTVTFTLHTVNKLPGAITILSGAGQTGTPNSILATPFVARVTDGNGNPTPNQLVTWSASANGATFSPVSATTGVNGQVSTTVTLGATIGPVTITATAGALTAGAIATIAAGAPASIAKLAGDLQSATAGTPVNVAPQVVVKDANGNPVPNAVVTWAVVLGGGTAIGTTTSTNAQGTATVGSWTLGSAAGQNTLSATTGLLSTTFSATGVAGTGSVLALATAPSGTATNAVALAQQPVVQLKDALGNAVNTAGVVITASVTSGTGTLLGNTATTSAGGIATFSGLTITGQAGAFALSFTAPGFTLLSFSPIALGAGPAFNLNGQAGSNQSATVGTAVAIAPAVTITDVSGNPVAGTVVTFTAVTAGSQIANASTSGTTLTVTSNALGIAALTSWTLAPTAGQNTLSATAAGLVGSPFSFAATGVAGNGSVLALTTAPAATATSGIALTLQPVVQLKDTQGNNVSTAGVVVSAGIASGTGTLTNATATTVAGGAATFSGLAISGTAGNFTLSFSSSGYIPLTSGVIALGAGSASTIVLSVGNNQSATAGTAVPIPPAVKVTDASGNAVTGTVVTFTAVTSGSQVANQSTSGVTVTVATNASGVAALSSWTLGSAAQSYTMTATAGGLSGSPVTFTGTAAAGTGSQFSVSSLPTSVTVGAVNGALTLQLVDALNNPVALGGVPVTFTLTSQPGNVTVSATAPTNAAGTILFPIATFKGLVGSGVLTITSPGYATFTSPTIPILVGAPSALVFTTQPGATAQSGAALSPQPVVQITDIGGNFVSQVGVTVTATAINAGSTLSGSTTAVTNASGAATFTTLASTGVPGPHGLSFDVPGLSSATFLLTLTVGQPASMVINAGNNQSATVNTAVTIAPSVHVADASNTPVSGVVVTFTVVTAGAQVSNSSTSGTSVTVATNAAGNAVLTQWTLGPTAQFYTMTASATGLPTQTFTASGVSGTGSVLGFAPPPSSTAVSGVPLSIQPGIQLKDAQGNAVTTAGVAISAAISGGTGTLANATATTTAGGVATFSGLTITGTAGTFVLSFSSTGYASLPSGQIAVSAGAANRLTLNTAPSGTIQSGVVIPVQPVVQVSDALNNPVNLANVNVVVSITGGGGTLGGTLSVLTNASGQAAFTNLVVSGLTGTQTLHFADAASTLTATNATTFMLAGPGSQLAFVTPPPGSAVSGAALSQQPVVRLKDAAGNNVALAGVSVTASISSGTGTLTNFTVSTSGSGVATFSGLTITGSAGNVTLSFGATGYTPLASSPIALSAGAASTIALNAGNNQTATVASAVGTAPSVLVTDANGNPVAGTVVQFTAVTAGSSVTNASTTSTGVTVTTNASGIAQLNAWSLSGTAGANTMTASVAGLAGSPVTFTAQGVAGAGTTLVFLTAPSASAQSGAALGAQPVIQLRDAFGNNVTTLNVTVTATISSGSGTLANATASTNASGVATFSGLAITGIAGNFTLQFNATGYSPRASSPIAISAGAAATIAISAGNNNTAQPGAAVAIPPAVIVTDAGGNPISGTVVTFTAVTSGGVVQSSSTSGTSLTVTTNSSGVAALVNFFVGSTAQTYTLTATTSPGLTGSPVTFTETAIAGPATQLVFATFPSSTALSGVALSAQPVLQIKDANNNPVATSGVVVTASITSGSGTLTSATATTNSSGQATFNGLTINGLVGNFTLSFGASGLTAATAGVVLSVGPATAIVISTPPPTSAIVGVAFSPQPAVKLQDSGGNLLTASSGVVITATLATGSGSLTNATATIGAGGVATFSGLTFTGTIGSISLQFSSGSLTPATSATIGVATGGAATITVNAGAGQSATVNELVAVAPSVKITDAGGNPVSGTVVTFSTLPSGSQIQNSSTIGTSLTVTSGATGVASLVSWRLLGSIQTDSLTASALTQLGAPLTNSPVRFFASGVALSQGILALQGSPSTSGFSGVALATQPFVQLNDFQGQPRLISGVSVTAFISSSTGVISGTTTVTTNSSGRATFTNLSLAPAGTYFIRFSSLGYLSTSSGNITIQ